MEGFSGSDNACSSSRLSIAPFHASDYLREFAGILHARRFQTMHVCGDCRILYDARHGANRDTLISS